MRSVTILVASQLLLMPWGTGALGAEDVASQVSYEDNPPFKRFSAEVRPAETLASAVPGVSAGGASIEAKLGFRWALALGGSYVDIDNMPQKFINASNDKKGVPLVDGGYGYSGGAGLRYYNVPIGDSAYGGVNLDYSETHFGWSYNDEEYTSTQFAVTPAFLVGYCWVWQSGMLVRLGGGAGLPSIASQAISDRTQGKEVAVGREKIDDLLRNRVALKLDLGVGMLF